MVKAVWNGTTIAESDRTEVVEGNHYFPLDDVRSEYLVASTHKTICPWKGMAEYYSLAVDPKAGSISFVSPVAKLLIGKSVGDVAGTGTQAIEIIAIA